VCPCCSWRQAIAAVGRCAARGASRSWGGGAPRPTRHLDDLGQRRPACSATSDSSPRHDAMTSIYSHPRAYEIAFVSWRNIPAETDTLTALAGFRPASVLELAAGPAAHAIEYATAPPSHLDHPPGLGDRHRPPGPPRHPRHPHQPRPRTRHGHRPHPAPNLDTPRPHLPSPMRRTPRHPPRGAHDHHPRHLLKAGQTKPCE